jgi:electron transport complex protein RnfG
MINAIKKNSLVLAMAACSTVGLVAITHQLTKDTIAEQQVIQLQKTLLQVISEDLYDNNLARNCVYTQNSALGTEDTLHAYIGTKNGEPSAIAMETVAPNGYNGKIKLILGLDIEGTVLGVRTLSHQETPGLGDKIDLRVDNWILGFAGKSVTQDNIDEWAVRKDGGQFDQFTGATITPRAVVNAVKSTTLYFNQNRDELLTRSPSCEDGK